MLVVESVFTWDIESFVDLCFDVVSFVTALTEKFQKFISSSNLFLYSVHFNFLLTNYLMGVPKKYSRLTNHQTMVLCSVV